MEKNLLCGSEAFFFLFFLFSPCLSFALFDFEGPVFDSKTYILVKEDSLGHDYTATYEYLDLEVGKFFSKHLSAHTGGWVRHCFSSPDEEVKSKLELTYAYVKYAQKGFYLDVGRQLLFETLYTDYLDGLHALWEITSFNGISLYYGLPVQDEDDQITGSFLGGRLYQRISNNAELGFSYLSERAEESDIEKIGADLWLKPIDFLEFSGETIFQKDWVDQAYYLRLFPYEGVTFSTFFHHEKYTDFFSSPFSRDNDEKENMENMDRFGGSIEYAAGPFSCLFNISSFEAKKDEMEKGVYYGLELTSSLPHGFSIGGDLYRMDGNSKDLKYTESMLFAQKKIKKVMLSCDTHYFFYDEAIGERDFALICNGNISYCWGNSFSAEVNLEYLKDHTFDESTVLLFKLNYKSE